MSVLLAFAALLAPIDTVHVTLFPDSTYQTIIGWGGHVYPQTNRYFKDDSLYESKMLGDLKTTHIRTRSVWYLFEGQNDNDDPHDLDLAAFARGDRISGSTSRG